MSGDEGSDVLAYAHCTPPNHGNLNGSVTLFAANPPSSAVTVTVANDLPVVPRVEYFFFCFFWWNTLTPVLNGGALLELGPDGSLPPMAGRLCTSDPERWLQHHWGTTSPA